jgi:hypothetical protein
MVSVSYLFRKVAFGFFVRVVRLPGFRVPVTSRIKVSPSLSLIAMTQIVANW